MSLSHCAHGWSSFLIIFRTKCRFAFYKNQPADKWVVIRVWGWSPSHMEVNLFRTNTEESINLSVKYLGLPGIIRKPSGTRFFLLSCCESLSVWVLGQISHNNNNNNKNNIFKKQNKTYECETYDKWQFWGHTKKDCWQRKKKGEALLLFMFLQSISKISPER